MCKNFFAKILQSVWSPTFNLVLVLYPFFTNLIPYYQFLFFNCFCLNFPQVLNILPIIRFLHPSLHYGCHTKRGWELHSPYWKTVVGLQMDWFFWMELIVTKSPLNTPALQMSLLQWAPCANLLFFQCMHPYLMWGNRLKPVKLMLNAQSWLLQLPASKGGSVSWRLPNAASDAECDQAWSSLHLAVSFKTGDLALEVTC